MEAQSEEIDYEKVSSLGWIYACRSIFFSTQFLYNFELIGLQKEPRDLHKKPIESSAIFSLEIYSICCYAYGYIE